MKLKSAFAIAAIGVAASSLAQSLCATVMIPKPAREKWFFTLPLCRRVDGGGEVRRPNASTWEAIEEGNFYPLGSSYRAAKGGTVVVAFGKECAATISDGASFATRLQGLDTPMRTLILTGGEVSLSLSGNLPQGLFQITTPAFTVINPAGDSKYDYRARPDGFEADIRCTTGSLEVEGRHFKIPLMNAADALTIRSEHDNLETFLYGRSGDFITKLDRGLILRDAIQDDGSIKRVTEASSLDWMMSVATRVRISRALPAIGSRMSVTMMTFDSAGEMKNNFAFSEGRAEVNTGELIARPKGDREDIAKRAAEVTNEAAAEETTEETTATETTTDATVDEI